MLQASERKLKSKSRNDSIEAAGAHAAMIDRTDLKKTEALDDQKPSAP